MLDPEDLPDHLAGLLPDGGTIAVGGNGLLRKPMALVRALAVSGRRDLRLVVFLGSVDVELLLAQDGLVAELHTAGVSLEGFGLAPRFRAARQAATGQVVPWSEGTLHAAIEAAARGLPSLPSTASPGTDLAVANPGIREVPDAFTDRVVVQARALEIDLALVQGSAVDRMGNVYVDGDLGIDDLLVRAADRVIVTVDRRDDARPATTAAFSRVWADEVVVLPGAAWPTGCLPSQPPEHEAVRRYATSRGEDVEALRPGRSHR